MVLEEALIHHTFAQRWTYCFLVNLFERTALLVRLVSVHFLWIAVIRRVNFELSKIYRNMAARDGNRQDHRRIGDTAPTGTGQHFWLGLSNLLSTIILDSTK